GSSHGLAEEGRFCTCLMIEVSGNKYLIDAGAPVQDIFINKGWDLKEIKAAFITHMHDDHILGLQGLCSHRLYINAPGMKVFYPNSYALEAYKKYAVNILHFPVDDRIEFSAVDNKSEIYDDGNIKVKAISTMHINEENGSKAYIIEAEGKQLLFTGDLKWDDISDYPKVSYEEDFDGVFCEFTHYCIDKQVERLSKTKTKKMFFYHVNPYNFNMAPKVLPLLPFPFIVVKDMDVIEF
ncbi:MAG: MBL fold metallo-hydrolase, partial [Bacillota bacterium]|nr:MBL fold metallo-hydrolase [Bacillota bacterium]